MQQAAPIKQFQHIPADELARHAELLGLGPAGGDQLGRRFESLNW